MPMIAKDALYVQDLRYIVGTKGLATGVLEGAPTTLAMCAWIRRGEG